MRPAPDLSAHLEVLRELLGAQIVRLREARALEQARSFIFPETTVIAKDVARLSAAVHLGRSGGAETDLEVEACEVDPDGPIDLGVLVRESEA